MKPEPVKSDRAHCRLYWDILDSNAWKALSWAQRSLYVALRRKLRSTNNGNIAATLSELRHDGFRSSSTIAAGLRALEAVGLIAKTRQGALSQGRKVCNLFRFTDMPVYEHPKLGVAASAAKKDWTRFPTVEAASAAIRVAHLAARTGVPRKHEVKRKKLRSPFDQRTGSIRNSNIKPEFLDSFGEAGASPAVQLVNACEASGPK